MKMPKIDKVLVVEALVGEGNELAHIDLIMARVEAPQKLHFVSR